MHTVDAICMKEKREKFNWNPITQQKKFSSIFRYWFIDSLKKIYVFDDDASK